MPWRSASSGAAAAFCAGATIPAATAPAPSASNSRRCKRIVDTVAIGGLITTSANPSLTRAGLGRLRLVPPPDGWEIGDAVFRHRIEMAEALPARGPGFVEGELGHHIVIPQQHPVERVGGGDELVAVPGEDHLVDQRIDRGILDADIVLRAGIVGRLRTPVFA